MAEINNAMDQNKCFLQRLFPYLVIRRGYRLLKQALSNKSFLIFSIKSVNYRPLAAPLLSIISGQISAKKISNLIVTLRAA
jgi:hypothetical protein